MTCKVLVNDKLLKLFDEFTYYFICGHYEKLKCFKVYFSFDIDGDLLEQEALEYFKWLIDKEGLFRQHFVYDLKKGEDKC